MRIGILTHYSVASHGAYLQLYAMTRILEQLGHTPYVLTYAKNYDFADESANKFKLSPKNIPWLVTHYLRDTGVGNCMFQVKKQRALKAFGRNTFEYRHYAERGLEAAVIGSDEVFSLQYGANPMMYGHGVGARRVVAYAPSFGQTTLDDIEAYREKALISSGLASLDALSARDSHTKELAELLSGKKVPVVLDPALLYSFATEIADIGDAPIEEPYIVVYAYTSNMNDETRVSQIRAWAHDHGCKTISLEGYHAWCDRNVAVDPVSMLAWFAHAAAVVTDTFHGTIASMISGAQPAIYTRSTNATKMRFLVQQLGLEGRLTDDLRTLSDVLDGEPLNHATVWNKIAPLRERSLDWLGNALQGGFDG